MEEYLKQLERGENLMIPLNDYSNKCGACSHFCWLVSKEGKLQRRGQCMLRNRVNYHQASQKACKKYTEK